LKTYFESLTRRDDIGANSYLLELDGCRVVLDAGLHPKIEGLEAMPRYDRLPEDSVNAIIVTHSHLDHTASLPVLMDQQRSARVYMTEPTGALVEAMLHNSVNVMKSKGEELGIKEYPLFTHKEVERNVKRWRYEPVQRRFSLGKGTVAEFFDAGHILGSVGVMIEHGGQRIFYTGDVNFEDQTIAKGAAFPQEKVDTLIIESTRGAHPRPEEYTREGEVQRLAAAIRRTLERGGSVLIPVFAMGKTQEVLMMLNVLRDSGDLPECPVYIGGLSTKMTVIFDEYARSVRRNHHGFEILKEMDLEYSPRGKRKAIQYKPGCIYALSSGMMSEKTVSNKFAAQLLHDERNALLMVGYADPDSPAGKILQANRGDKITLDTEEPPVELWCDVDRFDFSGHSTRDDLLEYILLVKPRQVLLVHGDPAAKAWFAAQLAELLPETVTIIPHPGDQISLCAPEN
jgi:Cft2 family RNA processing exonuclease